MSIRKRVICLVLSVIFIISGSIFVNASNRSNNSLYDSSNVILMDENPAFNQTDLNQNFENYTDFTSTNELPIVFGTSEDEYAHIVGIVLDRETNTVIPNASVCPVESIEVTSSSDGRFQIINLPNGTYNWTVTAEDYELGYYPGYSVHASEGVIIFTFYLSKDEPITITAPTHEELHGAGQDNKVSPNNISFQGTRAMNTKPTTRRNFDLFYNNKVETIGRQRYLYTVISSELYAPAVYKDYKMTDAQIQQLYYAQAIVANSYLEYSLFEYSNHENDPYNICSTSHCQVYNPTKVHQVAINAASICFENLNGYEYVTVILYKPTSSTYRYACTMFFSDCDDKGTITVDNHLYMTSKPCIDLFNGSNGHKKGFCQMGAAQRAKNRENFVSILHYYYTDIAIENLKVA